MAPNVLWSESCLVIFRLFSPLTHSSGLVFYLRYSEGANHAS